MRALKTSFALALLGGALITTPALAVEPANLDAHKEELSRYIDSGEYDRDIASVAGEAAKWLELRAGTASANANNQPEAATRLALVVDLDETLFLNISYIRSIGFGYSRPMWNAWVADGKAPAIKPVLALCQLANRLGVNVILLTGRHEFDRAGTEKNLRAIGCTNYARLIFKPNDSRETTGTFKTARRRALSQEGFVIIANIGDQLSDLEGGFAEKTFKLPNPFYFSK